MNEEKLIKEEIRKNKYNKLLKKGFIQFIEDREEDGKFEHYMYITYKKPDSENPKVRDMQIRRKKDENISEKDLKWFIQHLNSKHGIYYDKVVKYIAAYEYNKKTNMINVHVLIKNLDSKFIGSLEEKMNKFFGHSYIGNIHEDTYSFLAKRYVENKFRHFKFYKINSRYRDQYKVSDL